jgi:hypothetical protein
MMLALCGLLGLALGGRRHEKWRELNPLLNNKGFIRPTK